MFYVYLDNEVLYHPLLEESSLLDTLLRQEVNKAGEFRFTFRKGNKCFGKYIKKKSVVKIYDNQVRIFRGRVVKDQEDFYGNVTVCVEGELTFLQDSRIRPYSFQGSVADYFIFLVKEHNKQVDSSRQFKVGRCTVTDPNNYIVRGDTHYLSTWENIKEKLLNKLGGYIQTREEADGVYIDYLKTFDFLNNEQPIEFGKNLLDLEKSATGEGIATAIIPLGCKIGEEEERLTIASVNSGKDYLADDAAAEKYGLIQIPVVWEDVTTPEYLLQTGKKELKKIVSGLQSFKISAVDLHNVDKDIRTFRCGSFVKVISAPHDYNELLLINRTEINLLDPAKGILQLGQQKKGLAEKTAGRKNEISAAIKRAELDLNQRIKVENQKIKDAVDNLTGQMTGSLGGYKLSEYDSSGRWIRDLYMNSPDKNTATKILQVNMNGIGGSSTGYDGPYEVGMLLDGTILGSRILAGSITAEQLDINYKSAVEKEIKAAEEGANRTTGERLKNYWTTIETEAAIKNTADKISLSVKEKWLENQHDYCIDPDFSKDSWSTANPSEVFKTEWRGKKCVTIRNSEGAAGTAFVRTTKIASVFKNGTYTVKFKACAGKETTKIRCLLGKSVVLDGLTQEWKEFEAEFQLDSLIEESLYFFNLGPGDYVCITDLQILGKIDHYIGSEIQLLNDKISSTVKKDDLGTEIEQNFEHVRIAWNHCSNFIQFENGKMNIYNGKIDAKEKRSGFDENGEHFWRDGNYIGTIGTNHLVGTSDYGLVFDLEERGSYMAWAVYDKNVQNMYVTKLAYANKRIGPWKQDSFNLGCDFDFQNFALRNANLTEGIKVDGVTPFTGRIPFIAKIEPKAGGSFTYYNSYLDVKNGLIMAAPTA